MKRGEAVTSLGCCPLKSIGKKGSLNLNLIRNSIIVITGGLSTMGLLNLHYALKQGTELITIVQGIIRTSPIILVTLIIIVMLFFNITKKGDDLIK